MKKALFAFAAATAMLAGCQLADDFSVNSNANKGGRTPLTVTATFEDCTTRSILVADGDNYRPTWQAGDQIYIKGYIESNEGRDIYSAGEGGSAYTYFSFFVGDTLVSGPYEAYAPSNVANGFPGTQSQVGNVNKFIPMRAYSPETPNFVFKNLGGLLKLNIKTSQQGIVVKQVIVTSDQPMAGQFTVVDDAAVIAADGQKSIALECGDGIAIGADAVPFFVAVPANTYTGMTIQLIAEGGKKSNVLKMKSSSSVTVERSKYYEAEFSFDQFETVGVGGKALLPSGQDFNGCLKALATNDDLATYTQNDYVVSKIIFDTNSANTAGVNIADPSSDLPIYMSVDPCSGVALVSTPASEFVLPEDASYMFSNLAELEEIVNLKSVNTADVDNMSFMFYLNGCQYEKLKAIDLSNFNTENVTTMRSMFNGCGHITELNLSTFNTQNVEDMQYMFYKCAKIKELDIAHFKTENCTNLSYTFGYCYELESVNVKDWDVENCGSFTGTFAYCYAITSLDLENWDTSNATFVCNTFWHCHNLLTVNIPNFSFASATDVRSLFNQCSSIQKLDVSMLDPMNSGLSTSSTYTGYFFYHDMSLKEIYAGDTFMFPNRSSYFMCANNSVYEKRPGSVAGSLTIICDQDVADWFATTGLRWIANGYNADPIPVYFKDYITGTELSVVWAAN